MQDIVGLCRHLRFWALLGWVAIFVQAENAQQSLSRDEAIDEIGADASMDRMGDKSFWHAVSENLGEDRAEVRGKIAQFFDKYLGKIKEALRTKQVFMFRVNVARLEKQMQDALSALYAEGIREAAKNRKALTGTATETKNAATEGGVVQYSVRPNIDADLQNIKERNYNFNTELLIGTTSDFLVKEIGFKPLANYMSATKAYRAMVTKEQAIKDGQPTGMDIHYHNLGVNGLHSILEKSETPVVAYVSAPDDFDGRRTRLVLVTDYAINSGTGVTVVEPDLKATPERGRARANKDITVFSKEEIKKAVFRAAKENRLLYLDKNRGSIFNSGEPGTNNPVAISEDVLKDNIAKFWADVKWRDYKNSGIGCRCYNDT